jgi:hypothetical protein
MQRQKQDLNQTTTGIWEFLIDMDVGLYDYNMTEDDQYDIHEFSTAIKSAYKYLNEMNKLIDK